MQTGFPEQDKEGYTCSQVSLFYRYSSENAWLFIHKYDCVLSAMQGRSNHFYKQRIKGFPHGKPQYRIMKIVSSVKFETFDGEE